MNQLSTSPGPLPFSHAWADRLRNLATVLVIFIHVGGPVAEQNTQYDSFVWWSANFWDSLSRPAVPLFVMLSGFLLLGKDYPLASFLKRRFSRVLVPALFWMAIYSFYNFKAKGSPDSLAQALRNLVQGPVHYHLWFIYLIIGLYLIYPVLRPWVRTAQEGDYRYFFALCILGTWLYKILWVFSGLGIGIYFELVTNNCGYFVLGYYLGNKMPLDASQPVAEGSGIRPWPLTQRQLLGLAIGMVGVGTATTMIGTYWASVHFGGKFHPYFYDYLTPNVAMCAGGWFLLAKLAWNQRPLLEVEREFAAASFGIYFVHVLAMDWWSNAGYWHSRIHPAVGIPLVTLLVALLAFMLMLLLRALPGGKNIT